VVSLVLPIVSVVQSRLVMTAESPAIEPSKPLSDLTGPENVVRAISNPHMRVVFTSLHVVSRGCLVNKIFPDKRLYITKKEGLQA
jgi:hypothetical protein